MKLKHNNKHAIKLFLLGTIVLLDVMCFAGAFTTILRDLNSETGVIDIQRDTILYTSSFIVFTIILLGAFINIYGE